MYLDVPSETFAQLLIYLQLGTVTSTEVEQQTRLLALAEKWNFAELVQLLKDRLYGRPKITQMQMLNMIQVAGKRGGVVLPHSDLSGLFLANVALKESNLGDCVLERVNLCGADLQHCTLTQTKRHPPLTHNTNTQNTPNRGIPQMKPTSSLQVKW